MLLIDVDGLREVTEAEAAEVADVCRLHGAREVRVARDAHERELLWKGRKNAFGAAGDRPAHLYAELDDFARRPHRVAKLFFIPLVEKNDRMQVAVARMKYIADLQAIFLSDLGDAAECGRKLRSWNHSVCV